MSALTTQAPNRLRSRRPLPTLAPVVLAALVAAGAVVVHRVTGQFWWDLAAYRTGATAAATGDGNLYDAVVRGADGIELGFTYPPFAALLFQPLAHLGVDVGIGLWAFASVLALLAVIQVSWRAAVPTTRPATLPVLVATVAALPLFAVSGHLQAGQVGLFLMLIVLLDLTGDPGRRWYGLGVGVAAGIKLTPLVFVVYLVATGRWRAAGTALAGFLGTVAVGFAWHPADSSRFWGGALLDSSRVTGDPRTILNQSLHGALARLADSADVQGVWLPVAALVAVAGVALAAWCARTGDHLLGVLTCAATGLLVSPVSWHHHWVWWVPALVLVAGRSWSTRSRHGLAVAAALWLVLVASTTGVLAGLQGWDLHFHGPGLVYSNLYVLLGLAALGYLPFHLRGRPRVGAA
ncbi:glycosyltransferase 87 family protein [Micromonospora sp. NPDC050417]|uniref:glycosyltransferase 87 family protein n=1 Tax=Micromonospora sp. NPDC050417 TaxID=3364280 RepID=UPI00379A3471